MRAGVGYESNISRTSDPVPDAVYTIAPRLKLGHATERLDAVLDYRPVAELFHLNPGANGVDQILDFRSTYQLTPRSELSVQERFGYVRYLRRFDVVNQPTEVDVGLARTTINRADMRFRHLLTPRASFTLAASHYFRDSTRRSDPPVATLIGSADLNYLLTRSDNVGVGLSYTYTSIADLDSGDISLDARRTNSLNLFLTWSRDWNRKWRTLIRLGPAWVRSTRRLTIGFSPITGPPISLDQSLESQNVTAFGDIAISRFWSRGEVSLSYLRSLSAVSNVGSDSTIDAVFANFRWEPSEKWRLRSRAGWNRRISIAGDQSNAPIANLAPEITQFSFTASLLRRLSKRLGLDLEFRYQRQESKGFSRSRNSFDNYQVTLGARYEFAPLRP